MLDVRKLHSDEIRRKYNIEVKNRFEALGDIEDPKEQHDMILETYRDAAKKVIGWSKSGKSKSGSLDKKPRKEQAGFRPKRSTTEQIFTLRNTLEQANEWRAGLYKHFLWTLRKPSIRYTEKAYGTS